MSITATAGRPAGAKDVGAGARETLPMGGTDRESDEAKVAIAWFAWITARRFAGSSLPNGEAHPGAGRPAVIRGQAPCLRLAARRGCDVGQRLGRVLHQCRAFLAGRLLRMRDRVDHACRHRQSRPTDHGRRAGSPQRSPSPEVFSSQNVWFSWSGFKTRHEKRPSHPAFPQVGGPSQWS